MSICLIDTSVFCNIVDVPGFNQQKAIVFPKLKELTATRTVLLLPLVAVLETGNHIGHLSDGGIREQVARRFVGQVSAALRGDAPWTPTPFVEISEVVDWLEKFPEYAARGCGWGDWSIIKEWDRQRLLNPRRQVFIWAFDQNLAAFDTGVG